MRSRRNRRHDFPLAGCRAVDAGNRPGGRSNRLIVSLLKITVAAILLEIAATLLAG